MVERPHPGWWVAVLGGLGLTALLAFDPAAYALWARRVTDALSPAVLQAMLVVAVVLHVGEALYAWRLARRSGFPAGAWFSQTLLVGFPSLRLLLRRVPRR